MATAAGAAGAVVFPAPLEPVVRTLSGSGEYGMRDGPQLNASFEEPDGIAIAGDGTLYVADGTANDVRALANGTVRAFAGSPNGAAGFADGPSAIALFNRPVGVAVAKDGTVYVADSLNHRIRRITGGVVSTLAGNAAAGKIDGLGTAASFLLPKGIAVDDDGNVYVADFGAGIRTITPSGAVTTMSVPTTGRVFSVAARGSGADAIVAYTDDQSIHIVAGGKHRALPVGADRDPYTEGNTIGNAFGIAIVDADSVVVTDVWTHAVRYVNFSDPPFRPAPKTRTLAGGKHDGALALGGYRDGTSDVALVNSPYGIAYAPDGRVVTADSGNRRIREVTALDTRLPIASDLHNLAFPPHTYRIALIGDSIAWNDVLWPESMGGILEAGLQANRTQFGLRLEPSVLLLSASGGTLNSASDFIATNFGDGEADLVIFEYEEAVFRYEIEQTPTLENGRWKTVLPARVRLLAAQLRKQGTKFAFLPIPRAPDVSSTENSAAGELAGDLAPFDLVDNVRGGLAFESVFAGGQTHVISMLRPLTQTEGLPETPPLYNAFDTHLTVQGSIAVGRRIVVDLLAWKPWADATPTQNRIH